MFKNAILVVICGWLMLSCTFQARGANKGQSHQGQIAQDPAETRSLPIDTGTFDGVSYKKFRLGMSFKAFRDICQQENGVPKQISMHPGIKYKLCEFTITGPVLTVLGEPWVPKFKFISYQGVYRLYGIQGEWSKPITIEDYTSPFMSLQQINTWQNEFDRFKSMISSKYGHPAELETWRVGTSEPGEIYFTMNIERNVPNPSRLIFKLNFWDLRLTKAVQAEYQAEQDAEKRQIQNDNNKRREDL